jgi:FdhD protein
MRFEGCTLALIAGGQGRRLGGLCKAHLILPDGRTILQRTLDELRPLVDDVIVVGGDSANFAPLMTVGDLISDRGAPGGVYTACASAQTEWLLALATDMPSVSVHVLRQLWAEREGVDVVTAAISPGRLESLHAFYRAKTCALAFAPLLDAGQPSFAPLFESVRTKVVPAAELRRIDPELASFRNVNTPEDLQRHQLRIPPQRMEKGQKIHSVIHFGPKPQQAMDTVAVEEPLEIRVDEETIAVTMRTPGEDDRLALGFLFSEGLIRSFDDVSSIAHCGHPGEEGFGNVIEVKSAAGTAIDLERKLDSRRWSVTSSACGVCGRQTIEDLTRRCAPVQSTEQVSEDFVWRCAQKLRSAQPLFARTGGLHAAVVFDRSGEIIASSEDVGRHNAVDKVVGTLLFSKNPERAQLLFVSGRASFEIVQKAAAARIPIVASVSAASSLAVELAEAMGVTLISFVRNGSFNAYSHAERIECDAAR